LRLGECVPSFQAFPSNAICGPEFRSLDPSKFDQIFLCESIAPVFHCDRHPSQGDIVSEELARFEFPEQQCYELPAIQFCELSVSQNCRNAPNLGGPLKHMPKRGGRQDHADAVVKVIGSKLKK
jgi:hypothetical protein